MARKNDDVKEEKGETHEQRRHGHRAALIPRLHDRRVDAGDRAEEGVKVRGQQPVGGEVLVQDVEELHQSGGDVFRHRQVARQRQLVLDTSEQAGRPERVSVRPGAGGVPDAEEACGDGIELAGVDLVELAFVVDQHGPLEGFFGGGVVADGVVREVVEDFEGDEEARRRGVCVPVEDGAVDDFDAVAVVSGGRGSGQLSLLERGQGRGDFDDFEFRACVNFWVGLADIVEDVEHQGSIAGAELVDYQVMVRVKGEFVVGDEIASNGLAVVGSEELRGGVPELAGFIEFFLVKGVFEGFVALSQNLGEFEAVAHTVEVEGVTWPKDDDLIWKVPIIRVVKAICVPNLQSSIETDAVD